LQNGYPPVTALLRGGPTMERVIDLEGTMKTSLLIVIAVAAVAASAASAAGRTLPGFRSPSANIKCYYNPNGLTDSGRGRTLTCSIVHAAYATKLQHRCEAGDWHGFTLTRTGKPRLFCPAGASGDHIAYATLGYGKSWRRGPFTCTSRLTGVTCRSRTGHGLFISRQAYRTW
jgi:hypothetical protein